MDVESDFCRHGEEATGSNYTIYLEVAAATMKIRMKIKIKMTIKITINLS